MILQFLADYLPPPTYDMMAWGILVVLALLFNLGQSKAFKSGYKWIMKDSVRLIWAYLGSFAIAIGLYLRMSQ
jgi:hypothetical protein